MKLTGALPLAAVFMASSTEAIGNLFGNSEKPDIKPHVVDGFVWKDPFAQAAMSAFEPACEATKKFNILEFTLENLLETPPHGLKPWSKGLKGLFSSREYPGSWAGYDRHGNDRAILKMEYADIPLAARKWIEEEERSGGKGKGLFGIFEKPQSENDTIAAPVPIPDADSVDRSLDSGRVAIFAPGALYYALPLWAAEDSDCKGTSRRDGSMPPRLPGSKSNAKKLTHLLPHLLTKVTDDLLDLAKYHSEPASGNVVGWMSHTKPKDRVAQFTVKVQSLKEKAVSKDEL